MSEAWGLAAVLSWGSYYHRVLWEAVCQSCRRDWGMGLRRFWRPKRFRVSTPPLSGLKVMIVRQWGGVGQRRAFVLVSKYPFSLIFPDLVPAVLGGLSSLLCAEGNSASLCSSCWCHSQHEPNAPSPPLTGLLEHKSLSLSTKPESCKMNALLSSLLFL